MSIVPAVTPIRTTDETVEARPPIRDSVKRVPIIMVDLSDGVQPVVYETAAFAVHRRTHSATPVVTHDHDVLHLKHVDCKL